MRGRTPGPWQPSSVSAHAMHSADRSVCEAQIAITRRSSEATHCCAALSHFLPSVTPARHTIRLLGAASNHALWKSDGRASLAQIASRSRYNNLKIETFGNCDVGIECGYFVGRPTGFLRKPHPPLRSFGMHQMWVLQSCHTPCRLAYSVTGWRRLSAPVTSP